MCTLLRAHTPCAYYYVHTSMCTPTFHTWNAGPQNVSPLLHVEYGSVTKQRCYRTAWEAGPKPQTQIHHHTPCYYIKTFSSCSSNTKLWQLYKSPSFYWDHCMNFTQSFTVSALDEQHCLRGTFRPEVSVKFTYWALGWDHGKLLGWCIKFREPTPAFMLCNSQKCHVSRDLSLCNALGTKVCASHHPPTSQVHFPS